MRARPQVPTPRPQPSPVEPVDPISRAVQNMGTRCLFDAMSMRCREHGGVYTRTSYPDCDHRAASEKIEAEITQLITERDQALSEVRGRHSERATRLEAKHNQRILRRITERNALRPLWKDLI